MGSKALTTCIVSAREHGLRLDQMVARMWPGLGRRGARRMLQGVRVRVDGRVRAGGFRVQAGQQVEITPAECQNVNEVPDGHAPQAHAPAQCSARIRIVARNACFAALNKPAAMHSVDLSGGTGPSVQARLADLFPHQQAVLLNRLDRPVSGLLLAGLDAEARQTYALWQNLGQVRKSYLAVVHGQVNGACVIRATLDTANRRKVRLLPGQEPDALRWTVLTPLARRPDMNQTLVHVEIRKGRRHQIRAHLACLGHPIVQDGLYGSGPERDWIFLHHFQLCCPGLSAHCPPRGVPWDFWTRQAEDVLASHFQPSGADSAKET